MSPRNSTMRSRTTSVAARQYGEAIQGVPRTLQRHSAHKGLLESREGQLHFGEGDVIQARFRLVAKGLVAYRYPLFQLLPPEVNDSRPQRA